MRLFGHKSMCIYTGSDFSIYRISLSNKSLLKPDEWNVKPVKFRLEMLWLFGLFFFFNSGNKYLLEQIVNGNGEFSNT